MRDGGRLHLCNVVIYRGRRLERAKTGGTEYGGGETGRLGGWRKGDGRALNAHTGGREAQISYVRHGGAIAGYVAQTAHTRKAPPYK